MNYSGKRTYNGRLRDTPLSRRPEIQGLLGDCAEGGENEAVGGF